MIEYKGFYLSRGAYQNTTDDRMDRWYGWPADGPIDRRGDGWKTLAIAKRSIDLVWEVDPH